MNISHNEKQIIRRLRSFCQNFSRFFSHSFVPYFCHIKNGFKEVIALFVGCVFLFWRQSYICGERNAQLFVEFFLHNFQTTFIVKRFIASEIYWCETIDAALNNEIK